MDLRSRNHPKLPTRFSVELGGRNDLGIESVVPRTGRSRHPWHEPGGQLLGTVEKTDRSFFPWARGPVGVRLLRDSKPVATPCAQLVPEGRGPLRREDGVRPGNRRKDGTEAVKSIAHHLRSDGCR